MLHLMHKMSPYTKFMLACSGGSDSMAIADFYRRGSQQFELAYFNHGTPQANDMQAVVEKFANKYKIPCHVGNLVRGKFASESPEEFFRNERYRWLASFKRDVVTCHHLNDVAETWIFSSLHGNPKLINASGPLHYDSEIVGTIYRPFLLNPKQALTSWCERHNIEWCEDRSNKDEKYPRNFIRHQLLEQCLKVNPGLLNMLKRKLLRTASQKERT